MSIVMSTSSRTCGSSSSTICSIAAPCLGRAGRLLTLDLLEQREASLVQDRQQPAQQRVARLPDRQAHARARRAAARSRSAAAGTRTARRPCGACRAGDQSSRLAPTMLTARPPRPGARRTPRHPPRSAPGTSATAVPAPLRSRRARPSCDDADGDVDGVPLGRDHLGRPVEGARGERPARGQRRVARGRLRHPRRDRRAGADAAARRARAAARRGTAGSAGRPGPTCR